LKTIVTEIAPDVYRISSFISKMGIQINQFLIKDDEPFLMHTGFKALFPYTLKALSTIINPSKLRWIGISHFESDECGALNDWLEVAPHAQPLCSLVGANVSINDFAIRPPRPLNDGETLSIGHRRLRFLRTPHLPHGWDAGLFFEEVDKTLMCSDLFFQPGNPVPLIESGIIDRAREAMIINQSSPFAYDLPYTPYTDQSLQKLANLTPKTLATMHGSSFQGNGHEAIADLAIVIKEIYGATITS